MKYTHFLILVGIALLNHSIYAQNRFSIEAGGGISFPVGDFRSREPSIAYRTRDSTGDLPSFSKKENGMANNGFFYEIDLSYKVFNFLGFQVKAGQTIHSINTQKANEFLEEIRGEGWYFESANYQNSYILPGLQLFHSYKSWEINLNLNLGWSSMQQPIHSINIQSGDVLWSYKNDEPRDLKSTMYLIQVEGGKYVTKNLNLGLLLNYSSSDYNFEKIVKRFPFGDFYTFQDSIPYRTVNIGLKLIYSF